MQNKPQNFRKNAEKIFKKTGNPRGRAVLPLYIVDMLQKAKLENREPVTIKQLQKMILADKGIFYNPKDIMFSIANLHQFCHYITLTHTKVHAVRNHAYAFSIVVKNNNDV